MSMQSAINPNPSPFCRALRWCTSKTACVRPLAHLAPIIRMLCIGFTLGWWTDLAVRASDHPSARSVTSSMLACRLANYGPYQEIAWTNLQSLGVHGVFMNVPPATEVDATIKRLAAHGLTPVVLRGEANLSLESSLSTLAEQLAICEKMGVRYLFLSPKRHGSEKQLIYARLRQAGDIARRHGVTIALETHPDLG